MILILGGAFSGRHNYAKKIFYDLNAIFYKNAIFENSVYSISKKDAQDFANENIEIELSRTIERISSFPIVIATEMGCGVIPISQDDRKFREENGRLNIALAKIAKVVIFITCGIAQIIKGAEKDIFQKQNHFLIFRHGQTFSNVNRQFAGGLSDVPLTELGIEQAKETKSKMESYFENYNPIVKEKILNPKRVFVSPMIRAQQTAKILYPNSKIVTIEGLREMKMGLFENMTHEQMIEGKFADGSVSKENAKIYQDWLDSKGENPCPSNKDFEGESKASFTVRTVNAFSKILSQLEEDELPIVIAHGGVQMCLCESFFSKAGKMSLFKWQTENAMYRFGELK